MGFFPHLLQQHESYTLQQTNSGKECYESQWTKESGCSPPSHPGCKGEEKEIIVDVIERNSERNYGYYYHLEESIC